MRRFKSITYSGLACWLCIVVPACFFFTLCTLCEQRARYFQLGYDYLAGAFVLTWTAYVAYRIFQNRQVLPSPQYEAAFKTTLLQHIGILALAVLMLDHHLMLYSSILAAIVFWMAAGLIIARRPDSPKPSDIAIIRWGYIILTFSATCFAWIVNFS